MKNEKPAVTITRSIYSGNVEMATRRALLPVLSFILFCVADVRAQQNPDRLHKRDGTVIESRITEIGADEIKYKRFSYPDGPTYVIRRNELKLIEYGNGEREVIGDDDKGGRNAASRSFGTVSAHVTATGDDVWVGLEYAYRWGVSKSSASLADHYVGFNVNLANGFYYGFALRNANSISFSIPVAYRLYPARTNFYFEPYGGLRFNYVSFSYETGVIQNGAFVYEEGSGTHLGGLAGIDLGYTIGSGLDVYFRLHSEQGVGIGVGFNRFRRDKRNW